MYSGYVDGDDVSTMGGAHLEFLVRGLTSHGMDSLEAADKPSADHPALVMNFTGSNVAAINTGQVLGDIHAT